MSTARRGATAAAGALAGVVIVLLFVILAARAGPSGIIHGAGHDGVFHAPSTTASSPTQHQGGHIRPGPPAATPWWVHVILIGLAAIACGLVLLSALSAFGLLRQISLPGRRRATVEADEGEVDWLEDPVAAAEAIRKGSDLREQLLRAGSPRNAIVACWSRFEEQATEVGLEPRAWETPSEFTLRVLSALARDRDAVDRLQGLYVEARFSRHDITEEHRERAIEAVRRIHGSLLTAVTAESAATSPGP